MMKEAAKALGCKSTWLLAVVYADSDLKRNLDLAIFPCGIFLFQDDRYARMDQAWSVFQTTLTNIKPLKTEAEEPSIELHATLFSQELLWLDKICSGNVFHSSCLKKKTIAGQSTRQSPRCTWSSHGSSAQSDAVSANKVKFMLVW